MAFKEIIERMRSEEPVVSPSHLIALVKETGVHSKNSRYAENKIKELTSLLNNENELARALRTYLISLFSGYDALTLYTDAGILPGHGFLPLAVVNLTAD